MKTAVSPTLTDAVLEAVGASPPAAAPDGTADAVSPEERDHAARLVAGGWSEADARFTAALAHGHAGCLSEHPGT